MAYVPKLESYYKGQMVKSIKTAGGYATRVEDQFRVGLLDLIMVLGGTTILAEVKRFKGEQFILTPRQHEEARRIEAAGGYALSVGVHLPDETHCLFGVPKSRDGKIRALDCVRQMPNETFPQLLQRWIGEENARRTENEKKRTQHLAHGGNDRDDAAGQPARGSRGQLRDDWELVE